MSALIPANFGPVSTRFANVNANDELSAGIQSSFGMVGYKGKVWSIRYRGDETPLMREDGDGPRGSIEVVIVKAASAISKIFYKNGYVEGSNEAPDCFSNNGIAPEEASKEKQCDLCATCPHNQWGSRITPAGKQGKACSDSKRIAVVPAADIENEVYGGPMLLRVPAASLQDVAMYGSKMQQMGYPYYAVVTKISFDAAESYPKFVFGAIRPLTDDEADIVMAARDSHTVNRIMNESEFVAPAQPIDPQSAFEQELTPEQIAAAKAKVAASDKAKMKADIAKAAEASKPKKKAPEPVKEVTSKVAEIEDAVVEEVTESDEDRELREMEEKMLAIRARKAAEKKAAEEKAATKASTKAPAPEVEEEEEEGTAPSSFEEDLDSMLADLLP